jgi:hypothetical protein
VDGDAVGGGGDGADRDVGGVVEPEIVEEVVGHNRS